MAFYSKEVPSGTIDGANKTFTLANTIFQIDDIWVDGAIYETAPATSGNTVTLDDAPTASISVDYYDSEDTATTTASGRNTLATNRDNLRDRLKIDPNGKVWSDDTLDRFLNDGQRELLNDPDVQWSFQETTGYVVPIDNNLSEIIRSDKDNPENYYSKHIKQFKDFWASTGGDMARILTNPPVDNASGTPSRYDDYAENIFYNAGYQNAATYTTLHNMDTFDGDGTWTAGSIEATGVGTSSTYKEGTGAVSFNLAPSATVADNAEIYNSDMTAVDISAVNLNQGGVIVWIYLPDETYFDEVTVYFGSDSSNYYKVRNYKKTAQGNTYTTGWNRIFIPTIKRAQTGSPDLSAMGYLKVRLGYENGISSMNGIIIDGIQIVDKYIKYLYMIASTDLTTDSATSVVPNQYQFVYELYAEWQAWTVLSGREDKANQAFQIYNRAKNRMKRELGWNDQAFFTMRQPNKY